MYQKDQKLEKRYQSQWKNIMPDLIVRKFDNVYLKLICGDDILQELSDNFTFFVNGVNVATSFITLIESGGDVTAVFNTSGMGYALVGTDEVIAVGKFQ